MQLPGLKGEWAPPERVEHNDAGVPTYAWGLNLASGSDQTSIHVVSWAPPRWWWTPERWARDLMHETQRLRRELVARGVSKAQARRLVPRIRVRPAQPEEH